MSRSSIPPTVPSAPKSIGLSRRLLFVILALLSMIAFLFVFFLIHYAPHQQSTDPHQEKIIVDTDAATSIIQKIETHTDNPPSITTTNPIFIKNHSNNKAIKSVLSSSEFRLAGNAQLLVYHKEPKKLATRAMSNPAADNAHFADTLKAGTIIPATLLTKINSDLPGTILAKVRQAVFDSVTGNDLLIPQGSTLVGTYDAHIAQNQSRLLIVWSRLIFPNGRTFPLTGMPGVDMAGQSGLHDIVDHHYLRRFGSSLLFSLLSVGNQLNSSNPSNNAALTTQQMFDAAIRQQLSQTSMQSMENNKNVQATHIIRPGTNFNVLLTWDMTFPGPYQF